MDREAFQFEKRRQTGGHEIIVLDEEKPAEAAARRSSVLGVLRTMGGLRRKRPWVSPPRIAGS